jgi:hypothetical protein
MLKKIMRFSLSLVVMISLMSAVPPIKNAVIEKSATPSLNAGKMTVEQVLNLTPKQYEKITGVDLSFKEKMAFSMLKKELKKKDINSTINLEAAMAESSSDFSWGGFILGFLLGLIGVALVHIFSKDKAMRSASWKGCGVYLILLLLLFAL